MVGEKGGWEGGSFREEPSRGKLGSVVTASSPFMVLISTRASRYVA